MTLDESEVIDTDLTGIRPLLRRPDTVIKAETSDGPHLLVVEAQTAEDPSKIRSWAYYLGYLENKYKLLPWRSCSNSGGRSGATSGLQVLTGP